MENVLKLKTLIGLAIGASLFCVAGIATAFAASIYDMGTSTGTVGTAVTSAELEYTVDAGVQTWADADTLTIALPFGTWAGLTSFSVEYDTDADNEGDGSETAIAVGAGNGQYALADGTMTVKWNVTGWGAVVDDASTIRAVITYTPAMAGTFTYTWGGATAAGGDTNPSGTDTIVVSAANANASVDLGNNATVGTAGDTTITLTISSALANTDTITFTAPANLNLSGIVAAAGGTIEAGGGNITCAAVGQIVTCTTDGTITAATGTLVISGITSKYVATGADAITDFAVNRVSGGGGGADINSDSTVTVETTVAADPAAAIVITNIATVGGSGTLALTLTTPVALETGDLVKVTFPANFDISGVSTAAGGAASNFTGTPTFTASQSGQILTLTADAIVPAETGKVITIPTGIKAKYAAAASTITTTILDITPNPDANIATATDDTIALTSAGDAAASIALSDAQVGDTTTMTLTATTGYTMAVDDTIVWTMPAWVNVTNGAITVDSDTFGGTGTFTCVGVLSTRVITCTATGNTITATSGGTIVMSGMTTAYVATGADAITNLAVNAVGASGADINADTTVAIADTTVGDLTTASVTPKDMTASQYNPHTIAFTTTAAIPNLGIIKITYPSGWGLSSVNGLQAHTLSGLDGTWTASVSGQVITLTQTNGTATTAGAKSLKLESIKAPTAPGAGGDATILTEIAAGNDIETLTASTGTVTPGSNSSGPTTTTTTTTTTTETEVGTEEATTETETTTEEVTTEETTTEEPPVEPITVTTENGTTVTIEGVTGHWAEDEITAMTEQEIVEGDEEGNFNPDNNLNRAEAAAILYRVLGLEEPVVPTEASFADVAIDAWYAGYVSELKALELVAGQTETTYGPALPINRAEFLNLAMNVYHYLTETTTPEDQAITDAFSDLDIEAWYAPVVSEAYGLEFVHGSTCGETVCFNAGNSITRAEATKILYNMFYSMLTQ